MEGIQTLALFEEKVAMTPRDLANQKINISALILNKLAEKMEAKCSLHGWVVPGSTKVLSRSLGYLEKGRFTGDIVFHVQAQATVINPPSGAHMTGVVTGNNMMGMYVTVKERKAEVDKKTKETNTVDVDAVKIILPRDLHIGDEAFSKVEIGDKVRVEIKKSRFQVNDKFILSVGVFEGKIDSGYVVPKVEEQEEVVEEEKGPSDEAQERVRAFEEEEKKKEDAAAAATGVIFENEVPPLEPLPGATLEVQQPKLGYRETSKIESNNAGQLPYASGEPILFNAAKINTFKELDTRYPVNITIDGKVWPSAEHYYQAMKFPEFPEVQEQIRQAPTATAAQKIGKAKDPSKPIRADWKEKREGILRKALVEKFNQNPALKQILLDTYPKPLIYADANDAFWGYGRTKAGQNRLGRLLMDYRNTFRGMEALEG